MTDLQAGRQYSLSTENKNSKSVIFVKLTDSALQSIETFFNSKVSLLYKILFCLIIFLKSENVIFMFVDSAFTYLFISIIENL